MAVANREPPVPAWSAWGDWIERECGVCLPPDGSTRAARALADLALSRGFRDLAGYHVAVATKRCRTEAELILDAVVNGETSFFRHPAWFDRFRDQVLPECGGQVSVWSAGCSTGQEAYSLAIAARYAPGADGRTVRVLGTDVSRRHLTRAAAATYPAAEVRGLADGVRLGCFEADASGAQWTVRPEIADTVRFAPSNLCDVTSYPIPGFDVIFCRNVLLYFRSASRRPCIERLAEWLRPGGWLFLGPTDVCGSERYAGLTRVPDSDCVWYRRTD